MPPGKRRKVSHDENSARDSEESRLISTTNSDVDITMTSDKRLRNTTGKNDLMDKIEEEGKSTNAGLTAARTSSRVVKKVKRDISPVLQGSPLKKGPKEAATHSGTPKTKTKRQWELWQEEDIKTFFDALFEHGKDFDAIQNVLAVRCKKRSSHPSLIKNKEQVRHFYYRTCHKINKFIESTNDVKKDTQELYALINYGILRDSIKNRLTTKTASKLKELIEHGVTNVRVKGKNKRIRTPACSALKKLNNIEDPKGDGLQTHVPSRIVLELNPKTNDAWSYVQSMAHNPRLRMKLPVDRSLGAIITLLNIKWKDRHDRIKEDLSTNESSRLLMLYPHRDCKISPVVVSRFYIPKIDVTFASYKENIMCSPNASVSKLTIKKSIQELAKPSSDNSSETDNMSVSPPNCFPSSELMLDDMTSRKTICPSSEMSALISDDNAMFPDRLLVFKEEPTSKISLFSESLDSGKTVVNVELNVDDKHLEDSLDSNDSTGDNAMLEAVEKAHQGWSEENGKNVTLAKVYLMCGTEGIVKLEYDWLDRAKVDANITGSLSNMLRRLAHIATIEYRDPTRLKPASEVTLNKSVLCSLCGALAGRVKNQNKSQKSKACKSLEKVAEQISTPLTAASTSNSPVNHQVVMACDGKQFHADDVFRVPVGVPFMRYPQAGLNQVIQSIQQKQPSFLVPKRRKMVRQKPLVVQRTLLPKAPTGHIVTLLPSSSVISPKIIPQTPQTFSPASLSTPMSDSNRQASMQVITSHTLTPMSPVVSPCSPMVSGSIDIPLSVNTDMSAALSDQDTPVSSSNQVKISRSGGLSISPPNLSSLLDMSLSCPPAGNAVADKLLDLALVNSNSSFSGFLESTTLKCSGDGVTLRPIMDENSHLTTPPHSPSREAADTHWLNGDVNDISLTSFLTISPAKKMSSLQSQGPPNFPTNMFSESSQESIVAKMDVDATLNVMMNENSMDYVTKFESLIHLSGSISNENRDCRH